MREANEKEAVFIVRKSDSEVIKRFKLAYTVTAVLAFLIGVSIYALFRSSDILLFQIFPKPAFLNGRLITNGIDNMPVSILIFNLPDGLWVLSGLTIIRSTWIGKEKCSVIYSIIFCITAFLIEICQVFKNIPGIFDWLDLICMVFFALLESVVYFVFIKGVL
jgi:hypothetical protein